MKPLALLVVLAITAAGQDKPERPRLTGIAHIALAVHDVPAALAFYKDLLGYAEPFSLAKPDGTLSMTFLKVNDRQYIELFPETEPGTDRLKHISVETDDIDALYRYLRSKGVTLPPTIGTGRIQNRNFNVTDPDGHIVEFVQYMPEGWSLREKGNYLPDRVSPKMMHVGILVGVLEPALKFYRDTLGFQEFWRGSKDGKTLSWVNLRVPEGDTYIEFMLYDQLPAPTSRGSAHHLCLEVQDIEKAKAWLAARPAAKNYQRPLEVRTGVNRRRQLNLFDPDGTRTELMEPTTVDGHPTPSSAAQPPAGPAPRQ